MRNSSTVKRASLLLHQVGCQTARLEESHVSSLRNPPVNSVYPVCDNKTTDPQFKEKRSRPYQYNMGKLGN